MPLQPNFIFHYDRSLNLTTPIRPLHHSLWLLLGCQIVGNMSTYFRLANPLCYYVCNIFSLNQAPIISKYTLNNLFLMTGHSPSVYVKLHAG